MEASSINTLTWQDIVQKANGQFNIRTFILTNDNFGTIFKFGKISGLLWRLYWLFQWLIIQLVLTYKPWFQV